MLNADPRTAPVAPALVVIRAAASPEPRAQQPPAAPARLLKVLPVAACVLQIGSDAGALERAYRQAHPACRWHCSPGLPAGPRESFDLVVLSDGWQCIADPRALLRGLAGLCDENTSLVLDTENLARMDMLQRWVEADLTDDDAGPLARPDLRYGSAASVYKLLLDTGWMPTLADASTSAPPQAGFTAAALALAESVGVPAATAQRSLCTERFIVQARRLFDEPPASTEAARFAVVVPTTRESQLRLNVEHSPGLQEVDARIVSYRRARSPAEAFEGSLQHFSEDWVLLCHQDVYFPQGFGHRLNAVLAQIPPEQAEGTLIGFAGIGANRQTEASEPAGFVIDRLQRFDHPASQAALSLDELAIVLSRRSLHRIDPAIGWHLWATDLCLNAICTHRRFAQIVRLPIFHNSSNDYRLPAAFYDSAAYLLGKYAGFGPIHTLCGTLDERFLCGRNAA